MAQEAQLIAWSKDRPAWQREVMRRVAAGEILSDGDYDQLADDIGAARSLPEPSFGLEPAGPGSGRRASRRRSVYVVFDYAAHLSSTCFHGG